MPRYTVEVLEHVNHQVTVDAKDEDDAMAKADALVKNLEARLVDVGAMKASGALPDVVDVVSVVVLVDTTEVEEHADGPAFGWSGLCEEDPEEEGRCAYHQSACTTDGPGAEMPR